MNTKLLIQMQILFVLVSTMLRLPLAPAIIDAMKAVQEMGNPGETFRGYGP